MGQESPSIIMPADTPWQRQHSGCCSLSCSKTSLAEELRDTGRELKSCKGLGGGKVGTSTIPSPGSDLTKKAMAARTCAIEHLSPPKTMDRVHKGTGVSSILSESTGLQLLESHIEIPF